MSFRTLVAMLLAVAEVISIASGHAAEIQYTYDAAGRLTGVVDSSGNSARYNYDAAGNIAAIERFNSSTISVLAFSPAQGVPGTQIAVDGTGFSPTPSQNTVKFNGVTAEVASATSNQLKVTVPATASSGPITVTSTAGTATSAQPFTVLAEGTAPVISGFSPAYGGIGDGFTISGSGFATSAADESLVIGGGPGGISQTSSTSISALVVTGSKTGPLSLTTSGGSAASQSSFTVLSDNYVVADIGGFQQGTVDTPSTFNITDASKLYILTFSGVAGQRVSLSITGQTSSSAKAIMVSPDGVTMGETYFCYPGNNYFPSVTLPSTGTYQVVVNPAGTGVATLKIQPDLTSAFDTCGASCAVTIATAGQNGTLTFSGTPGQRVSLQVSGSTSGYTYYSVISPSGATLVDRFLVFTNSGFVDTVTLSEQGTYLVVMDPDKANTGSATLTLYDVPADVTGALAFGIAATFTITTPGQNVDLTFSGAIGQRISLRVTGSSLGYSYYTIVSPSGVTIVNRFLVFTSSGFIETLTLSEAGTYSLRMGPDGGAAGSATLTLYDVPADISGALSIGVPSTVTIPTPGQNAVMTFSGTSGQRIDLDVTSSSTGYTYYSIISPSGVTILNRFLVFTSSGSPDPLTLSESGTYSLVMDPDKGNTGSATLAIYDVSVGRFELRPQDAAVALFDSGGMALLPPAREDWRLIRSRADLSNASEMAAAIPALQ